jgi:mono/diheme cytochrome c family protein
VLTLFALAGCHDDMYNQPRYEPLEHSDFFDDGRAARPLVAGTVPYGAPPADDALETGREDGELVTKLPIELNEKILRRGQQRFNIYCSNCHGRTGDGDGMIVQRGYRQPPTFHSDRLRGTPIGHFFDVATHGFGAMPSYALQTGVEDRWAIAAYIRALQLSQHAEAEQLPEALRDKLAVAASEKSAAPAPANAEDAP